MIETSLTRILRGAIDETPGARGGALAAADGEMLDAVAVDREAIAFTTAHYAVLMSQVRAALGTFHFGSPLELLVSHEHRSILVHAVADGYFALLELEAGASLATAQRALGRAAERLRVEIA